MKGVDFETVRGLPRGKQQIEALYEIFREEDRLASPAMNVEFATTVRLVQEHLPSKADVLDLGAGAGRYSHHFARGGCRVVAVELVDKHARAIEAGIGPGMDVRVLCQDALTALRALPDASFDAVLCLGPLYHLHEHADRMACLQGCARVVRPGGYVYAALINSDMVVATMTLTGDDQGAYMLEGDYDKHTFRCGDFPFKFDTLQEANALMEDAGLQVVCRAASDGLNELCADVVNTFTPEAYLQWLRFHWYLCRQPHFLGASNHWLFQLRNPA